MNKSETARSAIVWSCSLLAIVAALAAVFLAFKMVSNHSYDYLGLLKILCLALGALIVWLEVRKEIHHSS